MDSGQIRRRLGELVGWMGVAGVGLVMLTQAVGWNGSRIVATLQSLTPYGVLLVLVIAAFGVWRRRDALATTGVLIGVGAVVLSSPLMFAPDQPAAAVDGVEVSVASVNLLFSNPLVADTADDLTELDPDVIVFTEFTIEHRHTLDGHPIADRYPFQINRDGLYAGGIAVWSKFPASENPRTDTVNYSIDASVDGPDGTIRLLAVHPPTPVFDFDGWQGDLERIGTATESIVDPTLVVGDFNASFWHPAFRDLLDRGLTDAHMAHGSGWSTSWPADEFTPPFVRLDHALTGNGLVSTGVTDFRVPGSDHVALLVTVTPAG